DHEYSRVTHTHLLFTLYDHHPNPSAPLSLHDALPIFLLGHQHRQVAAELEVFGGETVVVGKGVRHHRDAAAAQHGEETLGIADRSEEHTSELQSREKLVCRLLLEKKKESVKDEKYTET